MALRFASLGSGSEGNALVVASGKTHVMLDCGFSVRETERRLARLGLTPEHINAVVVTHEHSDHIGSSAKFCARYKTPLWGSYGTFAAWLASDTSRESHFHQFPSYCRADEVFSIGDLSLTPYTVPHDAREPLQFVFTDGQHRLGVLTDAGQYTPHLVSQLTGVDALVLECNHDESLLAQSSYPPVLKQRIGGPYGHLSNTVAAQVLAALDQTRMQCLVAAHLSKQNNTVDLVRTALTTALKADFDALHIATQDEGMAWYELV